MPETRIMLLRGVNVGGANRLPMAELREMLSGLGLTGVATHVQSGNAVFRDPGVEGLEARVSASFALRFGFRPALFVYTLEEYRAIVAENPFRAQGAVAGDTVHLFFLSGPAPAECLAAMQAIAAPDEAMALTGRALYLHAPSGIGRSKLAERLPRLLPVQHTARNQRSAEAILTMAEEVAA